jgi:hypothetical protein
MMIDRMYKFVQTVSSNEMNGNISPTEFNLQLHNAVLEVYNETLHAYFKEVDRERRSGLAHTNEKLSQRLRQQILHWLHWIDIQADTQTGYAALEADMIYVESVENFWGYKLEELSRSMFQSVKESIDCKPTIDRPVYTLHKNGLLIYPPTESIVVYTLQKPIVGNWTYTIVNGTELFNPDVTDFRDIDIHPSLEYDVSVKLLQRLGLNLKEEQLVSYGLQKENIDTQQKLAN